MQNELVYNQRRSSYQYLYSKEINDKIELYNKYKLKRKMLGIKDEFNLSIDEDKVIVLEKYVGYYGEKVTVPGFISCIKSYAFEFNYDIQEINICNGVYRIELNSIAKCYNLKIIDLPNSIVDMPVWEFKRNKKLQEIRVHSKRMYDYFIGESNYEGKVKLV